MAAGLDLAARDIDALVARMFAGSPQSTRPFDILEYQATFAELTNTTREIQAVLETIEAFLGSEDIEGRIDPIIEGANRFEDEVVNEVIDRAFFRGIALIVFFFVALTCYRWLARRLWPETRFRGGVSR